MILEDKINKKKSIIGVIGLGYVGLPLALEFAKNKIHTVGFDIDKKKLRLLKEKKSYLNHIPAKIIKSCSEKKYFSVSTSFSNLSQMDVVIICVPTPLNDKKEPDLSALVNTGKLISKFLKKEQLIILESSSYPGTTSETLTNVLERSQLEANKDFYISYSPEREDPGNKKFSTANIPKIVGADNKKSLKLSINLYKKIIDKVIPVSSTKVAEATKLTENIFRSVNIAMVNELKIIFEKMDIDVWEVIEAASSKPFGFMPFYPGPGLGGHCIPIDPYYLSYKAKELNLNTKLINLSGEINEDMPKKIVKKLLNNLKDRKIKQSASKVLLVGMAYKKDVDDMRETPSLEIAKLLIQKKISVDYHDQFIPKIPLNRQLKSFSNKKSIKLNRKNLAKYDAVIVCTDHTKVDYEMIAKNSKLIFDTRNVLKNSNFKFKIIKA